MACRGFLQCLLKLFNLILAAVGILLLVYAASTLLQWQQQHPPQPSPSAAASLALSSPPSPSLPLSSPFHRKTLTPHSVLSAHMGAALKSSGEVLPQASDLSQIRTQDLPSSTPLHAAAAAAAAEAAEAAADSAASLSSSSAAVHRGSVLEPAPKLPQLWFLYTLLGLGIFLSLLSIVGAVAAEVNSACCLSTYQFGLILLLLFQLVAAALIWLKEIPVDPTGEYEKERDFVIRNVELCKLAAVCFLIVQGTALLLAMMLRALQDESQAAEDDDDYAMPRTSHPARQPLLRQAAAAGAAPMHHYPHPHSHPLVGHTPPPLPPLQSQSSLDSRFQQSEAWRARMLEKYNLDTTEFPYTSGDRSISFNGTVPTTSTSNSLQQSKCAVG